MSIQKNGKNRYITGHVEGLELAHKFEFIFAGEIIEHVLEVDFLLKKIESFLKTEGCVCFTTPNDVGELAENSRQYEKYSLNKTLKQYFEVIKIEELPAINKSWPFLYAKCRKKLY